MKRLFIKHQIEPDVNKGFTILIMIANMLLREIFHSNIQVKIECDQVVYFDHSE